MQCLLSFIVFSIISPKKRQLVGLLCVLSAVCLFVFCLFLMVPWLGMWYVIVAFSGHTHLLLENKHFSAKSI